MRLYSTFGIRSQPQADRLRGCYPRPEEDAQMPQFLTRLSLAVAVFAAFGGAARAAPNCLKEPQPYALADDTVSWTMTIAPRRRVHPGPSLVLHADRARLALNRPQQWKVAIVGPGFRYFADPAFRGSDTSRCRCLGRSRKVSGNSIFKIE